MSSRRIREQIRRLNGYKTFRNGVLFSLFSFVNKGFIFLLLLILAGYISPAEYGQLSLFSTIVMVVGYFMAMSSEGYLSVAYFREGQIGVKKTFSVVFFIAILMFAILTGVLFLTSNWITRLLDLPVEMLFCAIVICFFTVFNNLVLDFFRIHEHVKMYGFISCGNALFNFIVSIVLVKCLCLSWQGRVYAQTGCCILFGSYGLCYYIKRKYITGRIRTYWKQILKWSIPLIPHLAASFVRQGCDRYVINYFYDIDTVGLFSFALNLGNIITMIGFGFNQSNSVDIYKILGDKSLTPPQKCHVLLSLRRTFIRIYIICTVVLTVCGYFVFPILLPRYEGAMGFFLILSVYGFLVCLYLLYTNYLFYFGKTNVIMYITFGSSALHLLLSIWLTRYSLYCTALLYGMTQFLIVLLIRKTAQEELCKNME